VISEQKITLVYVRGQQTLKKQQNKMDQTDLKVRHNPFWEAESHSVRQGIFRLSCSLVVHYCVHSNPPLEPVLGHLNPIHTPTSHCFRPIHACESKPLHVFRLTFCMNFSFSHNCIWTFEHFHLSLSVAWNYMLRLKDTRHLKRFVVNLT
jgi:hypothetical protein